MKYTNKKRNIHLCLACKTDYCETNNIISDNPKCPHCGAYLNDIFGESFKFLRAEVWVSNAIWYKPWTWRDGFWKGIIGQVKENEVKPFDGY